MDYIGQSSGKVSYEVYWISRPENARAIWCQLDHGLGREPNGRTTTSFPFPSIPLPDEVVASPRVEGTDLSKFGVAVPGRTASTR